MERCFKPLTIFNLAVVMTKGKFIKISMHVCTREAVVATADSTFAECSPKSFKSIRISITINVLPLPVVYDLMLIHLLYLIVAFMLVHIDCSRFINCSLNEWSQAL